MSTALGSGGGERSSEREEAVGDRAERGVVVEAWPTSPLKVIEADFLL